MGTKTSVLCFTIHVSSQIPHHFQCTILAVNWKFLTRLQFRVTNSFNFVFLSTPSSCALTTTTVVKLQFFMVTHLCSAPFRMGGRQKPRFCVSQFTFFPKHLIVFSAQSLRLIEKFYRDCSLGLQTRLRRTNFPINTIFFCINNNNNRFRTILYVGGTKTSVLCFTIHVFSQTRHHFQCTILAVNWKFLTRLQFRVTNSFLTHEFSSQRNLLVH